jgi:hypothetical protein
MRRGVFRMKVGFLSARVFRLLFQARLSKHRENLEASVLRHDSR